MSRILTFRVSGMTCHACEHFVSKTMGAIPGVTEVDVSLKQARVGIRLSDEAAPPNLETLNTILGERGYALSPEKDVASEASGALCELPDPRGPVHKRLWRGLLALIGVMLIVTFLEPLRSVLPSVSAGASLGAMLAFGLIASVSTCLATTGATFLAYHATARTRTQRVGIHLGRVIAFIVGGAILGGIGGSIPTFSPAMYGFLGIALALIFFLVGVSLLDLAPSPARLGLTLPSSFRKLGDRVSQSTHPTAPFVVGAVTFLMPCGFTQTAQALALSSGSPLQGALLLGAFALGTLPVLAGITTVGSLNLIRKPGLRLAMGALLVVFAFGQLSGGLTVLGSPITPESLFSQMVGRTARNAIPSAQAQEQIVHMTVEYGTYQPKKLIVRKGIPVRWEIDGKDVSGCASSLVAPLLGISRQLVPGKNVIQFTPTQTGSIPFSCAMGMIRGSFTVVL